MSLPSSPGDDSDPGVEELFGVGSDESTQKSRRAQYMDILDASILAPARIAWNDWRARLGVFILSFYVLMLVVEPLDEPVFRNDAPANIRPFDMSHTQEVFGIEVWQYPLGTDAYGKPILADIVNAAPAMFELVLAGSVVSIGLAVIIGTAAGYLGGFADDLLMGLTDIVMTIPGMPLILLLAAIFRPTDPFVLGMLLAIDNWPGLARALRSQVLTIRGESYVESSKAMGVPTSNILKRDIVPQLMPYIMINAAGAGKRVITEAVALYFLGILPRGAANWGKMMDAAYKGGAIANLDMFYWILWPMLALSMLSFALVMLAQGLDQVFNPRLRARHAKRIDDDAGDAS